MELCQPQAAPQDSMGLSIEESSAAQSPLLGHTVPFLTLHASPHNTRTATPGHTPSSSTHLLLLPLAQEMPSTAWSQARVCRAQRKRRRNAHQGRLGHLAAPADPGVNQASLPCSCGSEDVYKLCGARHAGRELGGEGQGARPGSQVSQSLG